MQLSLDPFEGPVPTDNDLINKKLVIIKDGIVDNVLVTTAKFASSVMNADHYVVVDDSNEVIPGWIYENDKLEPFKN